MNVAELVERRRADLGKLPLLAQKRLGLLLLAFEAGLKVRAGGDFGPWGGDFGPWWPELAPLNRGERAACLRDVAGVLRAG